jgi:LPXTG-motif cell wall-anchored protein
VRLKSSQLTDAGQRDVQGMSFRMYQVAGALAAGDPIELSLSGNVASGEVGDNTVAPLLIGAGIFVAVLAGGGYYLVRRRENQLPEAAEDELEEGGSEPVESSDELLDAILALDDLYQSGKLPEAAYQTRRAELKARLAAVLADEK